jgi:hypothetical protein
LPAEERFRPSDRLIRCAGGVTVAQRGVVEPADLTVGPVRPIDQPDQPPVEAQRADHVVWRRHWSEPDRLVIDFVDIAITEERDGVVTFDRQLPHEMEQHLLLDHILPLVLARRGALVIHGAVIGHGGESAVLVGATGAGKSTLTAFAWQRGWTVGGDDGAVINPAVPCTVEPTYPTIRLTPASVELLGIDPDAETSVIGKTRIHRPGEFVLDPSPLRLVAIIEPVPDDEPAAFHPMPDIEAHARLFGSTFHADLSRSRMLPGVIDGLATVIENALVGRLAVPRGIQGLAAAERVLSDTFDRSAP